MKKLILSIVTVVAGFASYGQVVCAGVSPAAIQGNYDYAVQGSCGQWPGETDDGTWGTWTGGLDFNNPGDFIQAELMLVEDGTPGLNPQGNPISQEGCNALTNNLTGKIAVVYRNTCWFSSKVYYAEEAGAIGVIVINREDGVIGMLGNTDPLNGPLGVDCNIPAVFLSKIDGDALVTEMGNGPVEMFIGNKLTAFGNDVGSVKGEFLVPEFGGDLIDIFDGFELGIQAYNYGLNDQAAVTIQATIDGPGGNVYDETVGPINMLSGDTLFVFNGNTEEFPLFDLGIGNYVAGDYTLTYNVDMGGTDDAAFDNVYTVNFTLNSDVLTRSGIDGGNLPIANAYPSNSTVEYESCTMIQEPNFNLLTSQNKGATGAYIIPHADTNTNDITGAEIFVNVYQWDDAWVDLDDPNYQFDAATADAFQNLNIIAFGTHYPASNSEVNVPVLVDFNTPFYLVDNQRYLICAQTFQPDVVSFGYDGGINHDANQAIFRQPISTVKTDNGTFTGGWNGYSAPSIALRIQEGLGIDEVDALHGNVFPNPAKDKLNIQIEGSGEAQIILTDISGKVVINTASALVNGATVVDINALDAGMYVLNVTLEDGRSVQFNVIKD
jgi:hypothetical protein